MPRLGFQVGSQLKRTERQKDFYYAMLRTESDGRLVGGILLEVQVIRSPSGLSRLTAGKRSRRSPLFQKRLPLPLAARE